MLTEAIGLARGPQPQRRAFVADRQQQRQREVVAQDAVVVDAMQFIGSTYSASSPIVFRASAKSTISGSSTSAKSR